MRFNQHLANAYQAACMAEIEALKPGNIHIFADGHGMMVQDFITSAMASSKEIAQVNLSLGERIHIAVEATWQAVACNTNLGIVLLCAPLIQAAYQLQDKVIAKDALYKSVEQVLANSTVADAQLVFDAIKLMQPAGLGVSHLHDVQNSPQVRLQEVMQVAADKDTIALQYSNGFSNIFNEGLSTYEAALARWQNAAWATTALHLFWMANFPDSHVARKYGSSVAIELQKKVFVHQQAFLKQDNPKHYQVELMRFDDELKQARINPGTSADLTVATLLLANLLLN